MNKKLHHFIPQFYLRQFSHDAARASIGVYNIKVQKYITRASIVNQARRKHFYGKDNRLEDVFAKIESGAAPLVKFICEKSSLPNYNRNWHAWLIGFVVSLQNRTERSAREMDEDMLRMMILCTTPGEIDNECLPDFKSDYEYTPAFNAGLAAKSVDVAMDLKMCLLVSCCPSKFVTSDNPVVLYNQFAEFQHFDFSMCGIGNKGLQMFLPISPNHCLFLFDGLMYKVTGDANSPIQLNNSVDIDRINKLQYINCDENIFFGPSMSHEYLKSFQTKNLQKLREEKPRVRRYETALVGKSAREIRCGLQLSFLQLQKRAKQDYAGKEIQIVRNPRLCQAISEFDALVLTGQASRDEWSDYLKAAGVRAGTRP